MAEIKAILDEQPVAITPAVSPTVLVKTDERLTKAPDTTVEEDLHSKSQRRINLVWELTQAIIAVVVTVATIYSSMRGIESLLLGNAFTLIIALYFVRANHSNVGGVQLPTLARK